MAKGQHFKVWGIWLVGLAVLLSVPAAAQDGRSLSISSLRLSSGEAAWLGQSNQPEGMTPTLTLRSKLLGPKSAYRLEIDDDYLAAKENAGSIGLETFKSRLNFDHRVGRVFNLSVALSSIKQADLSATTGRRSMSIATATTRNKDRTGSSDLWSLDVGLDWLTSSGHGVHLGYLYGADPLTGEAEGDLADQQSVALGYTYDLDWLYVNLGYVYSFGPVLAQRDSDQGTDSTVFLRFQLRF